MRGSGTVSEAAFLCSALARCEVEALSASLISESGRRGREEDRQRKW